MTSYTPVRMDAKKSKALIVHCADPRFQEAYRAMIDHIGKYHDLVVAPGASKAVAYDEKVIENIKLLHSLHNFEDVHILDHVDCGAFGPVDDERRAHSKMLNAAEKKIKAALPDLKVTYHLLGKDGEIKLS